MIEDNTKKSKMDSNEQVDIQEDSTSLATTHNYLNRYVLDRFFPTHLSISVEESFTKHACP